MLTGIAKASNESLSALPYYGGKGRAEIRLWLNSLIPFEKQTTYCEPFAGMIGLLLSRPRAKLEIINDLDDNIANWWHVVRWHPAELTYLIERTERGRKAFDEAIAYLQEAEKEAVKWAWAVFVVLRQSFTHSFYKPHFAVHYKPTTGLSGRSDLHKSIQPLSDRLADVQVENRCALEILDRLKDIEQSIIYCDPPYRKTDCNAYLHKEIAVDDFSNLLLEQKGKVAISGFYDEWDHLGWQCHERERKSYVAQGFATKKHKADRKAVVQLFALTPNAPELPLSDGKN